MTRAEILALIGVNLPDNTSRKITAAKLREVLVQIANDYLITGEGGGGGAISIIQAINGTYATRPASGAVTWIGDTFPSAYQQGDIIEYTPPAIDFEITFLADTITVTCDITTLTRTGVTGVESYQPKFGLLFTYVLLSSTDVVLETITDSTLSQIDFAFTALTETTYKVQVYVSDGYIEPIRFTENTILTDSGLLELVPTGFDMVDGDANGRADDIIRSFDTSGNTTYTVVNDSANGWVGGYQRVTATTGTADLHFMAIKLQASYNPNEAFFPNTSYHVKFRYRATSPIRLEGAGGVVFQSITNETAGTISANRLTVPINTGNFVEVEFDLLSNLTNETDSSVLQVGFNPTVASPELYEFQISITENV